MTLDQKIEKLKSLDYPVEDFTVAEINRHYERVVSMNITTSILEASQHPHSEEIKEKGMTDVAYD